MSDAYMLCADSEFQNYQSIFIFYCNTFEDDQAKYINYGTINSPNKKASVFTIVLILEGNSKKLVAQTVCCRGA